MKYIASKAKVKKANKHRSNHYGLRVKGQQAVSTPVSYEKINLDADGYKKLEKIYNKESSEITFYSQTDSIALLDKKNGYTFFKENLNFFNAFENKIFISPVSALSSQEKIMGVFAKEPIGNQYRYKYCAIYQTEKIKSEGNESDAAYYTFTLDDEYDLSGEKKRTWPALVNSASSKHFANLEAEIQNGQVTFRVLKNIQPNQQLLIWYGDTYSYPKGEKRFLTPDDTSLSAEERYRMSANLYDKKPLVDLELNTLLGYGPDTVFIVPKRAQLESLHMPYYARKKDGFESQQQNLTHLHLACWQGNIELVESLQKLGANIHYQLLERGFTPLHLLILSKHKLSIKFKIFEYILETYKSIDLFLQDQEDYDILTHLIITNQLDLLEKILDKYAPKFKRNRNESMLYSFLKYGSIKCIDRFVPQYFKNKDYEENKEDLLELYLELQTNEPGTKRAQKVSEYIQAHFPEETKSYSKTCIDRPLSKLAAERDLQGETEHQIAVYTSVHEDSSTISTKQITSAVKFQKKSIEIEMCQTDSESTVNTSETSVQSKLPSPTKTNISPNISLKTMGFFTHQEPPQQEHKITTPSHSDPLKPVIDAPRQQNNITPSHLDSLNCLINTLEQQNDIIPSHSEPLNCLINALEQQNDIIPSHLEHLRPFIECIVLSFHSEYERMPNNHHFEYIVHSLASHNENDLLFRMLILYFYISSDKKMLKFSSALLKAVVMTMPMYCLNLEQTLVSISQQHFGTNLFPCFNSLDFCFGFQSKLAEIRMMSESCTIITDDISGKMYIQGNQYNTAKLPVEQLDEKHPILRGL